MSKNISINIQYEFLSSSPTYSRNINKDENMKASADYFYVILGRLNYIRIHIPYISKCILDFRLLKLPGSGSSNARGILKNFLTFSFKVKSAPGDNININELRKELKDNCESLLTFTFRRDHFDIKEVENNEKNIKGQDVINSCMKNVTHIIEILRPLNIVDETSKVISEDFKSPLQLGKLSNLMLRKLESIPDPFMGYSVMLDTHGFDENETKLITQAGIKEKITDYIDSDKKDTEITKHPICKIRFFSSEKLSDFFRTELYECFGSEKPQRNYFETPDKLHLVELKELMEYELIGDNIIREKQDDGKMISIKINPLMMKVHRSLKMKEIHNISTIPYYPIPGLKNKKYNSYTVPITEISEEGITIGEIITDADFRPTKVKIADKDRLKHIYVIGKTGTGKSSLLASMIIQDIEQKKSAIVVDPHGELCDEVVSKIGAEHLENIVLIDPSLSYKYPGCSINILDIGEPESEYEFLKRKDFLQSELTTMFLSLYGNEVFGPRIQEYFAAACLTLMEPEIKGTLVDVPRLFTDDNYRRECREKISDEKANEFWNMFDNMGSREKDEMIPYFSSKFAPLIRSFLVRNFVEGKKSNLQLENYIENGKTVLIKLSKGELGELGMSLIGMLLIARIKSIILSRSKIPENKRKILSLYVDEFQNFISKDFQTFLSEARKYGLGLVLAHQYLGQMEQAQFKLYGSQNLGLLESIMGNVGNNIIFRIGIKDAETIQPFLGSPITKEDLVNLDNYEYIGRILNKGVLSSPMTVSAYRHPYLDEPIGSTVEFNKRIDYLMEKFSKND